jgi:hypothetical protein
MDMLQLFEYIEDNNLTPNQYYLLWSIYMKRKPKHINNSLELRQLKINELVDSEMNLTTKGKEMIDLITTHIPAGKVVVKSFDADQYLSVFPRGKLPSGKAARANKKVINEAFTWFFKNYDYTWDTVMSATTMYVDEYENKNYLYMKNSQYFIRKNLSDKSWESELANYCELVLSGYTGEDEANHFSEKVV